MILCYTNKCFSLLRYIYTSRFFALITLTVQHNTGRNIHKNQWRYNFYAFRCSWRECYAKRPIHCVAGSRVRRECTELQRGDRCNQNHSNACKKTGCSPAHICVRSILLCHEGVTFIWANEFEIHIVWATFIRLPIMSNSSFGLTFIYLFMKFIWTNTFSFPFLET